MPAFPVDEAQLLSLFFESVAYGVYLVTFGMCIRALLWSSVPEKGSRPVKWPSVIMAGAMFVCATLDTVFNLRHNLDAFVFYKGGGGAIQEFEHMSYWVNVGQVCSFHQYILE
jgi:hypothetical protein